MEDRISTAVTASVTGVLTLALATVALGVPSVFHVFAVQELAVLFLATGIAFAALGRLRDD